jgi:hypothetical protein
MILAEDVAAKAKRRVLVFIFTKGTAACQLMFGRGDRSREKGRARGDRYLNLHFVLHVVLHVAVRYWLIQIREICGLLTGQPQSFYT